MYPPALPGHQALLASPLTHLQPRSCPALAWPRRSDLRGHTGGSASATATPSGSGSADQQVHDLAPAASTPAPNSLAAAAAAHQISTQMQDLAPTVAEHEALQQLVQQVAGGAGSGGSLMAVVGQPTTLPMAVGPGVSVLGGGPMMMGAGSGPQAGGQMSAPAGTGNGAGMTFVPLRSGGGTAGGAMVHPAAAAAGPAVMAPHAGYGSGWVAGGVGRGGDVLGWNKRAVARAG